jgi:hypothetical protein
MSLTGTTAPRPTTLSCNTGKENPKVTLGNYRTTIYIPGEGNPKRKN